MKHTTKNKRYKLGETCFENYTGLPPAILKDIKDGFYKVNVERDEILIRWGQGEKTNLAFYHGIEIPSLINEQVRLGFPLSSRQESKLFNLYREYVEIVEKDKKRKEKEEQTRKLSNFIQSLNSDQQRYISSLPYMYINELYNKMTKRSSNENTSRLIEGIEIPLHVNVHLQLNLPLFDFQLDDLYELHRQKKAEAQKAREIEESKITIQKLNDRHIVTLRAVRDKEETIPPTLWKDWLYIQEAYKSLQKGEDFDYDAWKLKLANLTTPIRVERDGYL